MPEFAVLGVVEAAPGFEPPTGDGAVPADITGLCFDHYPRPGQGTVSGRPTLGLELVLISPRSPRRARRSAIGATSSISATSRQPRPITSR